MSSTRATVQQFTTDVIPPSIGKGVEDEGEGGWVGGGRRERGGDNRGRGEGGLARHAATAPCSHNGCGGGGERRRRMDGQRLERSGGDGTKSIGGIGPS